MLQRAETQSNLSLIDQAQWKLSRNVIRGAVVLRSVPDSVALEAQITRLATTQPRLRAKVDRSGDVPAVLVADSLPTDGLERRELPEITSRDALFAYLGGLNLDTGDDRLWRWILVETPNFPEAPAALLVLWHHALADGRTGLAIIQALGDERPLIQPSEPIDHRPWWRPVASTIGGIAWLITSARV